MTLESRTSYLAADDQPFGPAGRGVGSRQRVQLKEAGTHQAGHHNKRGLGTERARLGTFRGLGTERARLGTFRGFGTERARLGTF